MQIAFGGFSGEIDFKLFEVINVLGIIRGKRNVSLRKGNRSGVARFQEYCKRINNAETSCRSIVDIVFFANANFFVRMRA